MMQYLTTNAITVINAVEKKLPNGEKNIKRILVKTTMEATPSVFWRQLWDQLVSSP